MYLQSLQQNYTSRFHAKFPITLLSLPDIPFVYNCNIVIIQALFYYDTDSRYGLILQFWALGLS
jgi:hypothetical protein